jgi:hypothetical protein
MVDRLNEPESRFHGSLVTNVLDLVEILPRLNVNGDTDLNRFAEQVKGRLCNYSAQDLKKQICCALQRPPTPPTSSPKWMACCAAAKRQNQVTDQAPTKSLTACPRIWRRQRRHET